jgi:predicted Rossmann-fold nucleotide-binding protein
MEELLEIIAWLQLGIHDKPVSSSFKSCFDFAYFSESYIVDQKMVRCYLNFFSSHVLNLKEN